MSEEIKAEELFPEEMTTEEVTAEADMTEEVVAETALEETAKGDDEILGAAQAAEPVDDDTKWYVVHTYSGYENKIKANKESFTTRSKRSSYPFIRCLKKRTVPVRKLTKNFSQAMF